MIMSETPDYWLVIKITSLDNSQTTYKVFATWYGSYLSGESWRLNSGIKSVALVDDFYIFTGYSGSQYHCHKNGYGNTGYGTSVLSNLIAKSAALSNIEIMNKETDWLNISYE